MKVSVPVSVGELLDKISILEIKNANTNNSFVERELTELQQTAVRYNVFDRTYLIKLRKVNEVLWNVESEIRKKESLSEFDNVFIELSRKVYTMNDIRAAIKKDVNLRYDSYFQEVKIY